MFNRFQSRKVRVSDEFDFTDDIQRLLINNNNDDDGDEGDEGDIDEDRPVSRMQFYESCSDYEQSDSDFLSSSSQSSSPDTVIDNIDNINNNESHLTDPDIVYEARVEVNIKAVSDDNNKFTQIYEVTESIPSSPNTVIRSTLKLLKTIEHQH